MPKIYGTSRHVGQGHIDDIVKDPHAHHNPTQPPSRPRRLACKLEICDVLLLLIYTVWLRYSPAKPKRLHYTAGAALGT